MLGLLCWVWYLAPAELEFLSNKVCYIVELGRVLYVVGKAHVVGIIIE